MLDFGLTEFLLILAIAILVIGPEQAPKIMYQIGRVIHRIRHMKFALNQQFEHFMDQQDRQNPHTQTRFERHGYQSPQQADRQDRAQNQTQNQEQTPADQDNIEMMDDLDESMHMPIPPSMQPDIIPDQQFATENHRKAGKSSTSGNATKTQKTSDP